MKNINIKKLTTIKQQSGFTLLEILVALVLGIAILTSAIAMQITHRKGFDLSSNKLAMQSNAKFAVEFISQSLRSAGAMGCKTGLELKGETNDGNCSGKVCIAFNDPTIAYADFRPGFEVLGYEYTGTNLTPAPPIAFKFVSLGQYNDSSDVLTVAGAYGEVYGLNDKANIAVTDSGFQLNVDNLSQVRLKQSQYGVLAACEGGVFFKVTSSDTDIALGNISWGGGGGADDNATGQLGVIGEKFVGGEGRLSREFRRAAVVSYFVGMHPLNDAKGVPSLYQDVDGESKRLIEGVEEIQIEYGLSASDTARNIADRYVTADVIAAASSATNNVWEQVVSVRIGLIMRSVKEVYGSDQTQQMSLACINNYTQAVKTDKYSRSTYCAEVSLRNRLTGART